MARPTIFGGIYEGLQEADERRRQAAIDKLAAEERVQMMELRRATEERLRLEADSEADHRRTIERRQAALDRASAEKDARERFLKPTEPYATGRHKEITAPALTDAHSAAEEYPGAPDTSTEGFGVLRPEFSPDAKAGKDALTGARDRSIRAAGEIIGNEEARERSEKLADKEEERSFRERMLQEQIAGRLQAAREAAAARLAAKEEADRSKREVLLPKEVNEINNFDTALDSLGFISQEKEKFNTGPWRDRFEAIKRMAGAEDADFAAFKARVGDELARYIRSISGAAASDSERRDLQKNRPTTKDDDDTFITKAAATIDTIKRIRERYLGNLRKQGRDVSEYEYAPLDTSNDTATQTTSSKVRVRFEGTVSTLDPNDPEDAASIKMIEAGEIEGAEIIK